MITDSKIGGITKGMQKLNVNRATYTFSLYITVRKNKYSEIYFLDNSFAQNAGVS